jgi:putative cell wall-binding protein
MIKEYGKDQVIVVGGEGVITKQMVKSLEMNNIKRIAGNNRFETAANIITALGIKTENIYIANGDGFADALTGSVLAAKSGAPMLLANADNMPWATLQTINKNPNAHFAILGGTSAVNEEVVRSLAQ